MISERSNEILRRAASLAEAEWDRFAAYCRARESGLRRDAFDHLGVFIRSMKGASIEQQRNFVNWLCERLWEGVPDADALAPEPLLQQFVFPALNEWSLREPHDAIPFRWLGVLMSSRGYSGMRCGLSEPDEEAHAMLQTALRLDPQDQIARVRLIECCIGRLEFHAHHLPDAYLGEPEADLQLAQTVESLISDLLDLEQQSRLRDELRDARDIVTDWIGSRAANEDFRLWRSRHGRPFSQITRVYVYDSEKHSG